MGPMRVLSMIICRPKKSKFYAFIAYMFGKTEASIGSLIAIYYKWDIESKRITSLGRGVDMRTEDIKELDVVPLVGHHRQRPETGRASRCVIQSLRKNIDRMVACQSGSNAVEFAIVAPVLLLIFFGLTFCGIYLGIAHSLHQISADTSRYAMVGLSPEERSLLVDHWIDQVADDYVLIRPDRLTFSEKEEGGALTVTVNYDASYLPTPPIVGSALGLSGSIRRSASVLLP